MQLHGQVEIDGLADAGTSPPASVAQLAAGVFVLDSLITKGLSVHGQTLVVENKLAKLLCNSFQKVMRSALDKACKEIETGPQATIGHAVTTLTGACVAWSKSIAPVITAATAEAYRVGKVYAYQRAYGHVAHVKKVLPPGVKIPLPNSPPQTASQYWLPNNAGVFDWRPATYSPAAYSIGGKILAHMSSNDMMINGLSFANSGGTAHTLYAEMTEAAGIPKSWLVEPKQSFGPKAAPIEPPAAKPLPKIQSAVHIDSPAALHELWNRIGKVTDAPELYNVMVRMVNEGKLTEKLSDALYDKVAAGPGKNFVEDFKAMLKGKGADIGPPGTGAASILTGASGASPPPTKPKGKGGPKPGGKMAEVKPSFSLVDKQAVEAASKIQTLWIGNYASMDLSQAIAKVASDVMISQGYDRKEAATQLKEVLSSKFGFVEEPPTAFSGFAAPPTVPTKWNGTSMDYLEMVASNAANTARNYGQLNGFKEMKVTTYTIVNPLDERTCSICEMMDGKTMETSVALDQMDEELKSINPDQIKFVHPWVHSDKEAFGISGANGDGSKEDNKKLSDAGFSFPPYHGRCRCSVDITDDFEPTFDPVPVDEAVAPASAAPEFIEYTDPLIATPPALPISAPEQPPLPTQTQQRDPEDFPWTIGQLKDVPMNLAGMHTKSVYESPDGEKWVYKPQPHFRAMVDRLAADFAKMAGRPTAEVYVWSNGASTSSYAASSMAMLKPHQLAKPPQKSGSIQRMFKGVSGDFMDHSPLGLKSQDAKEIQKEHIFDWFISQHDSHGGNIIKTKDGIKFIDKGQAFRFLGKDRLDLTFGRPGEPNPSGTYYHEMFSQYALGKDVPLAKLSELSDVIKGIKNIPDDVMAAKLRPYAKAALAAAEQNPSMKGASWMGKFNEQQFIDYMLARKNNIEKDVTAFYNELEAARAKALGKTVPVHVVTPETAGKKPKVPRAEAMPLTEQEWGAHLQVAKKVGAKGRSFFVKGSDFENGNWLLYGSDGDGSFMDAKVRAGGNAKLMSFIKGLAPPPSEGGYDATYEKLVTIAKSYNTHMKPSGDGVMPDKHNLGISDIYQLLKAKIAYPGNSILIREEKEQAKHYMEFLTQMWQPPGKNTTNGEWQPEALGRKLAKYIPKAKVTNVDNGLPPGWSVEAVKSSDPIGRKLMGGKIKALATPHPHDREYIANIMDQKVYKFTSPAGDDIYYKPHAGNRWASQGQISYHANKPIDKLTPKELDEKFASLGKLGLEVKKADAKDLELIWLRKVAFKERKDSITNELIPESLPRDEQIKKLQTYFDKLKLPPPSKRVPETNADGGAWAKWYSPHLEEHAKGLTVKHTLYGDNTSAIKKIIDGGFHELVATVEKVRVGIPVAGQSPDQDLQTGGASYVFTRIRAGGDYKHEGLYFKSKALTDLDAVSYRGDEYGNVQPSTLIRRMGKEDWQGVAKAGASGDETIFKHGLSFDLLDKIVVTDSTGREEVLKAFKDKGIKEVGGTPVEQLVIVKRQPSWRG